MCFVAILFGMLNLKDHALHLFNTATFENLMKSPGELTIIGGSQCTLNCVSINATFESQIFASHLQGNA